LIPAATFLAASTRRIRLATGVLLLPHHGAERVAEASAAFQSIAPGRLRLAMGIGYWRDEFEAQGLTQARAAQVLDEAFTRLTVGDLRARIGATEVWSGQTSDAGMRRAGRHGLGLLFAEADAATFRRGRALWRAELGDRDGDPPRTAVFRDVWVDRDPRRVEWIRGRLLEMWRNYSIQWSDDPVSRGGTVIEEFPAKRAQRDAMAEATARRFVVGSPAQVVDELAEIVEAGADGFAFRVRFDGVGGPDLERCLDLLAGDVMPQLRRMRDLP
jgi:alkanesulfonate monooxygenase SsuD/methylene tetrahydromethanopterin reductase-like flavin-dependent oxidoreductase (luciferase family)